mmetsp:Transcript_7257/g.20343  ORF Transcript_7257/g.20343 Transcript_7257/m.20343 type:complete len:247 (+) Transcript_7257:836-1576(+)
MDPAAVRAIQPCAGRARRRGLGRRGRPGRRGRRGRAPRHPRAALHGSGSSPVAPAAGRAAHRHALPEAGGRDGHALLGVPAARPARAEARGRDPPRLLPLLDQHGQHGAEAGAPEGAHPVPPELHVKEQAPEGALRAKARRVHELLGVAPGAVPAILRGSPGRRDEDVRCHPGGKRCRRHGGHSPQRPDGPGAGDEGEAAEGRLRCTGLVDKEVSVPLLGRVRLQHKLGLNLPHYLAVRMFCFTWP